MGFRSNKRLNYW